MPDSVSPAATVYMSSEVPDAPEVSDVPEVPDAADEPEDCSVFADEDGSVADGCDID